MHWRVFLKQVLIIQVPIIFTYIYWKHPKNQRERWHQQTDWRQLCPSWVMWFICQLIYMFELDNTIKP